LADIQLSYAHQGLSLAQAALCGSAKFIEWQHYPRNDGKDVKSGYEFYYHAHPAKELGWDEHGHFHLFKRDLKDRSQFNHLIAISLNPRGLPIRIFTTNRWVTGETFEWAERVMQDVDVFQMNLCGRMSLISKWLCAFLRLFAADIGELVRERDMVLSRLAKEADFTRALEMREHHVLSCAEIDFMGRLKTHLTKDDE
jgi:hypothetical protein